MAIVTTPNEALPSIGAVRNPAIFFDGDDVFLCYESSPDDGNAVIKFGDVIEFQMNPMNVDGLPDCRYPIHPWAFNEISDAQEIVLWHVLKPRYWMISFRDVTVEIMFGTIELLFRSKDTASPQVTLVAFLGRT